MPPDPPNEAATRLMPPLAACLLEPPLSNILATTLALEGLILFSNNKTAAWLQTKSENDRKELFKKARKLAPEFRDLYKERRQKFLEDRAKVLRDKQLALQ